VNAVGIKNPPRLKPLLLPTLCSSSSGFIKPNSFADNRILTQGSFVFPNSIIAEDEFLAFFWRAPMNTSIAVACASISIAKSCLWLNP
jgi:hypothetical protein